MHILTTTITTLLLPFLFLTTTTLASDLQIETLNTITCKRQTKTGDTVQVHYRGTLASDNSEFDNSYDRGQPLSFRIGGRQVIQGWEDGLLDMCVGEKRKLVIPPRLAYGDRNMGPIPAGSTLIFETELVGIQGVGKDEL